MRTSGITQQRSRRTGSRRQAGVAMITVLVALVALMVSTAIAIDAGMLLAARTQVQNAADVAALAAARNMIDVDAPAVTLGPATTAAVSQASLNVAAATPAISLLPADVVFGGWDLDTRTFDGGVDLSDPDQVTAVSVTARLDDSTTGPVPAVMARVMGRDSFTVGAEATAYLGFAGGLLPGSVLLPIVIDCCKLKGADCKQDYCSTVDSSPPNPCPLDTPQTTGANTVSCLEFFATPDQNACWTQFSGEQSSVNTADMIDIIESGQEFQVSTEDPIYLDNGTKTPVIDEIRNRFLGGGGYTEAAGTDRYEPIHSPPQPDSWVVGLPVVECQTGIHCASGDPMRVVGAVCFEIREVVAAPDKIIRGRFLCKDDPLFDECDLGLTRSGGLDFGIRADIPVLVR